MSMIGGPGSRPNTQQPTPYGSLGRMGPGGSPNSRPPKRGGRTRIVVVVTVLVLIGIVLAVLFG